MWRCMFIHVHRLIFQGVLSLRVKIESMQSNKYTKCLGKATSYLIKKQFSTKRPGSLNVEKISYISYLFEIATKPDLKNNNFILYQIMIMIMEIIVTLS